MRDSEIVRVATSVALDADDREMRDAPLTKQDMTETHGFGFHYSIELHSPCHRADGLQMVYKSDGLLEFSCKGCKKLIGVFKVSDQ